MPALACAENIFLSAHASCGGQAGKPSVYDDTLWMEGGMYFDSPYSRNRLESRENSVARPAGFEPATARLEGECSIQLS